MKIWNKFVAIVLVMVTTAGMLLQTSASSLPGDISGDGKITVFDAQLLAEHRAGRRTLNDVQLDAARGLSVRDLINHIFRPTSLDAIDTNGDGIREIYTAEGLQSLHTWPADAFILMDDLDLEGQEWTPVAGFCGSLNGNGKTISNFMIRTCVADSVSSGVYNQAFFGDTTKDAAISDLHLQDVTVAAAGDTTAISFFVGCHRGQLNGCTVTGTIIDTRQTYPSDMYTGIMAGKLLDGNIIGGTSVSFTDEYGRKTTTNLCADVAVLLENKAVNVDSANPGKVGLAGYAPSGYTVSGKWKDSSNSTRLLSQTLQDRRHKVVDYMNAMATVEWIPVTDLHYTAANGTDQIILAGQVHVGLPYNNHNGSYERFLSSMATQNENGVWTAKADLESCGWDSSLTTKHYIRPYTSPSAPLGAGIQKTKITPAEVISIDSCGFLYYATNEVDYYYGTNDKSEYIHIIGNSANQYCMQLYDVSGATPVPVTSPVENKLYKLAAKDADGVIWFFNGKSNIINGVNSLITTKALEDAADVYVEVIPGGYRVCQDEQGAWSETGFYLTMGNACNTSVSWAWMQVSNISVSDNGTYRGGFNPRNAQGMIPTDTNRTKYGMYPVGNWEATAVNNNGKFVSAKWDPSKAAYSCTGQVYTPQILNDNGIDTIYEAYAQTRMGDALACYVAHWTTGNPGPGGHVRMVVADTVVIRNADGIIDGKASYLLETEQGVGFTRGATKSTWAYAKNYSFYEISGKPSAVPVALSTKTYLPVTIRALQEEYLPEVKVHEILKTQAGEIIPPISPTEGLIYAEHSINSVTLTIVSDDGAVKYQHEAFTGVSADSAVFGAVNNRLYMADLHAKAFYEAADKLLTTGNTYTFHVDVLLSTGETVRLVNSRTFVYSS